jgi:hypothetical protein
MKPTTYGDLKRIVAHEPRGDYPSHVNPSLTHSHALKVLAEGLATHLDDTRLDTSRHGEIYTKNVLRECVSFGADGPSQEQG